MAEHAKIATPVRWEVIYLVRTGHSYRETADMTNVSKSQVNYLWNKFNETGQTKDRRRSGRPKKLQERDKREILREVARNPMQSIPQIKEHYNSTRNAQNQIQNMTISRLLTENHLISRRVSKKWKISPKNMKLRVKWAKDHLNWSSENWQRVFFTDESRIQNHSGIKRIRIRKGQEIPSSSYVQSNRWDVSVMVWGYISSTGIKGISFVEETVTGERYQNLLETKLFSEVPGFYNQELILQHDNAPAHREGGVKEMLEANSIEVLEWPAQSPDLNLIEACWRFLKKKLRSSYEEDRELKRHITEIWEEMPLEFINKLYRSIPERLRAVIKAKGGPTKY
jgi:transposase